MDYLYLTHQKIVEASRRIKIEIGVLDHWQNEVEGLKHDADALNEYYRQFPRTDNTLLEMSLSNRYLTSLRYTNR
jgi:hypothetical protein